MAYGNWNMCWCTQRICHTFILLLIAIFEISLTASYRQFEECGPDEVYCSDLTCIAGSRCNFVEDCYFEEQALDEIECVTMEVDTNQGESSTWEHPYVLEGTDVILKCTLSEDIRERHASEMQFFDRIGDNSDILLPNDTFRVLNNNSAEITAMNLQRGRNHFTCILPEQQFFQGGNVYLFVGIRPVAPMVECENVNLESFSCRYWSGDDHGDIRSNFTVEYVQNLPPDNISIWKECSNYDLKENACHIDRRFETRIRVREFNPFGVSPYTEVTFRPMEEVTPNKPGDFRVTDASSDNLILTWNEPANWYNGNPDSDPLNYQIRYTDLRNPDNPQEVITHSQDASVEYNLQNLIPFTQYKIDIRCQCKSCNLISKESKWSEWTSVEANTTETAPGAPVKDLHFREQTSEEFASLRDVFFTWQSVPEGKEHGIILGYNVYVESKEGLVVSEKTEEKYIRLNSLQRFMTYTVKVNAYSSVGEGPNATLVLANQSAVLSPPLFKDPKRVNPKVTELQWEQPIKQHEEVLYYQVRYRPVVERGERSIPWKHAIQTQELEASVRVNCSLVKGGSDFQFELSSLSNEGQSKAVIKELYMCDNDNVITIVASVFAVCFCVTLLLCCILLVKNSDITKPAPEPYFIDAVLRPTDSSKFQLKESKSSPKHEKESFDTLRSADSYTELLSPVIERMSSKDNSSNSTDQGIHDMDIDSVDLKNGIPATNTTNQTNIRRCNRYSSGMGQSIVSDCGQQCNRSTSNPGMEVLSEDYEDAVFEEIPQDIDDGSTMCLSHTYARSGLSHSPLTPNDDIGSSSSLLSNGSSGPNSLPSYSQMACNNHSRLSSSGSDSSGVDYHIMGSQGLAPMKSGKDTIEVGSMTYSKLSQIPTSPSPPPDVVVDLDHATASDEDIPPYNQLGLSHPTNTDSRESRPANKSPSHFDNNNIPIKGSMIRPHNEIIVATALMPSYPQPTIEELKQPCKKASAKKAESKEDVSIPLDDHSYSVMGDNSKPMQNGSPTHKPTSAHPNPSCDGYVPNNCMNGFSIPNGVPSTNISIPTPPCNDGYVPNNSPPFSNGTVFPQQTLSHSPPKSSPCNMNGYTPATPQAMAAIAGGKRLTSEAYVPNTALA